jgi:cell division protein FtsZ
VGQPAGERRVVPQTAQAAPAAPADVAPPAAAPAPVSRPAPAVNGGGITVPPLPPIPGPVNGRRPLSSEDFEEELDIPEFLRQ